MEKTVWRGIWVQSGTNETFDERAETLDKLLNKIWGKAYPPHESTIRVWEEEEA